mmetsp:Transcript_11832/g.30001  ORF Transcript_11832/g.30001 Transcript_11832/m.30001 type:complete len:216 (+) Transcript_11832:969-1616(+)
MGNHALQHEVVSDSFVQITVAETLDLEIPKVRSNASLSILQDLSEGSRNIIFHRQIVFVQLVPNFLRFFHISLRSGIKGPPSNCLLHTVTKTIAIGKNKVETFVRKRWMLGNRAINHTGVLELLNHLGNLGCLPIEPVFLPNILGDSRKHLCQAGVSSQIAELDGLASDNVHDLLSLRKQFRPGLLVHNHSGHLRALLVSFLGLIHRLFSLLVLW